MGSLTIKLIPTLGGVSPLSMEEGGVAASPEGVSIKLNGGSEVRIFLGGVATAMLLSFGGGVDDVGGGAAVVSVTTVEPPLLDDCWGDE